MTVVFSIIFIIAFYLIIKNFLKFKDNEQSYNQLIEDSIIRDDETQETTIDWDYLKSVNDDIIGWIVIEGTNINYPILQDDSRLYYLKHNYLGNYSSYGSIFTLDNDAFCRSETSIYGHNMLNGSMFSLLGNYLNRDFLFSHQNIKIYTPEVNYEGLIFSAYSTGYSQEKEKIYNLSYEEKLEYYINSSKIKINNINNTEKILKLITCSYLNNTTIPTNQRYYIVSMLNEIN